MSPVLSRHVKATLSKAKAALISFVNFGMRLDSFLRIAGILVVLSSFMVGFGGIYRTMLTVSHRRCSLDKPLLDASGFRRRPLVSRRLDS